MTITAIKDENYWKATLPTQQLLDKTAEATTTYCGNDDSDHNTHGNCESNGAAAAAAAMDTASVRGPFGKMAQLALF